MRRILAASLLPLILGACAIQSVAPPAAAKAPEAPSMAALPRFEIDGRLQVRDGDKTAAVGVEWMHAEEGDEWLFSGPLGQGVARIRSDPGGARMTLADGRRVEAASAAELAERLFDVQAPFAQLPRWVTARLPGGAEVRELDAAGRPLRVIDQGWTVEYLEYTDDDRAALPRKIDIHRGDTRLRLIIDTWNP
ncbi:MAG: outer membrane lipoprotein LolB [Proteobacteria bacterium]|nr:outer membrane lipoprotein LolB [Pseudomonadota bacterium]